MRDVSPPARLQVNHTIWKRVEASSIVVRGGDGGCQRFHHCAVMTLLSFVDHSPGGRTYSVLNHIEHASQTKYMQCK